MASDTVFHMAFRKSVELRLITRDLDKKPAHKTPYLAVTIAEIFKERRIILSLPAESGTDSREEAEQAILVHKFKTQLSAFAQDKSRDKKFSSIILIKAAVEAAGLKTFHKELPLWVRSLLAILKGAKDDGTIQLSVVTLTRIFVLCQEQRDLIREITSPVLSEYISICIRLASTPETSKISPNIDSTISTFDTIIESLISLTPLYHTQIRPFTLQIQTFLGPWLAPTLVGGQDGDFPKSPKVCNHARELLALLHACASKNSGGEAWTKACQLLIDYFHETADLVLRAIYEEWTPSIDAAKGKSRITISFDEDVADVLLGPFFIPAWSGIIAGVQRLQGILLLIETFITTRTLTPVTVPLGNIYSALDRTLLAVPPTKYNGMRFRGEVDRHERETLFMYLPELNKVSLVVLSNLIKSFPFDMLPATTSIINQILHLFTTKQLYSDIRGACYLVLFELLNIAGPSLLEEDNGRLEPVYQACCDDLLPTGPGASEGEYQSTYIATAAARSEPSMSTSPDVRSAARKVLPLILSLTPLEYAKEYIRASIDAVAILTQDEALLLASIMNMPQYLSDKSLASALPILAQQFPGRVSVECFLRPHMPVHYSYMDGEKRPNPDHVVVPEAAPVTQEVAKNASPAASPPHKRARVEPVVGDSVTMTRQGASQDSDESDFEVPAIEMDSGLDEDEEEEEDDE